MVSDIVLTGELPPGAKEDEELWAACVSRALAEQEYLRLIREAGFSEVSVVARAGAGGQSALPVASLQVRAVKG